jgi:trk system potassium uptake protein TrkA
MNVLVLGAGEIGFLLAGKLIESKHNVTIIENDAVMVQKAREHLDANIIEGNAADYSILKRANLDSFEVMAAVSNNDEVNMLSGLIAKKKGVETVIVRVKKEEYTMPDFPLNDSEYSPDLIIQPEKEVAKSISQLVRNASATDYYEFEHGKVKIVGIRIDKNFKHAGVKLAQLGTRIKDLSFTILALIRAEHTLIPKGNDYIKTGDQIFFICENSILPQVLEFFGKDDSTVQNVMIIGGGLVGQYVAQDLENEINVKIIESDYKKAKLLAQNCRKSLIIQGDATEMNLLQQEDISNMDEFISVSGDDETNIITSMLAQHLQVPRTITLIKKVEYLPMTASIGLDAVVSKQVITVNAIRQFIRRRRISSFTEIPGLDALVLELEATTKSKITKKQLMKVDFPEKAIVGAVIKPDGEVEIPSGMTQVEAGDKVLVFFSPEKQRDIEKLF